MSRGRFYLRCESAEWDFIRELAEPVPFDAAIISDRYLAEYPAGHSRFGEPRDRLVQSLAAQNVYWSVDPDTARLGHPKSVERQRPHAANRPLAQALPLPLTTERLSSQDAIDALVDAGVPHQLTSRAFAAPYLETESIEDPRFGINVRLLERSAQLAGDRTLIAYLQVLGRDLRSGNARALAKRLAAAGAEVIMIRVRRFEAERASAEDVLAYAATIDAGTRAGARVVADCVGRLGPVLVAVGADGFATNARYFRVVPADLHPPGGGGGAGELLWEVPAAGEGRGASDASSSDSCAIAECPAPDGPSDDHASVRIHNLHEFQRAARQAAAEGLAYATQLASSSSPLVREWGRALQELARRAA